MEQNISLVIKAPMHPTSDFVVKCSEDWTVVQIKRHLSAAYPGNPNVDTQRLIYSGRLLQDNLSVKDFARKFEDNDMHTHILHLVCSTLIGQSSTIQPPVMNTPNLEIPSVQATINVNPNPMNQQFVAGADMVAQQLAMYQQLYAQYLALYPNSPFQTQFVAPVAPSQVFPATEPPAAPVAPAEENAENNNEQQRPENMRMNAAGGMDEEEEGNGNRDWLDWFYICTRAIMLLSILYLYSSLSRFMIFVVISIFVYLYHHRNVLNLAQQDPARVEPQPAVQQPQDPQHPNENPPEENNDAANESGANSQNAEDQQDHAEPNTLPRDGNAPRTLMETCKNIVKSIWMIIFSFVMSLIPDPPAAVAQN